MTVNNQSIMCVYELCGGFFITMNIFVNHGRVHVCIVVVFSSQLKQSFLVKYLNYFLRSDEISGLFHNLLHNTRIVKFDSEEEDHSDSLICKVFI